MFNIVEWLLNRLFPQKEKAPIIPVEINIDQKQVVKKTVKKATTRKPPVKKPAVKKPAVKKAKK